MNVVNLPERSPDLHKVLTDRELCEAIIWWIERRSGLRVSSEVYAAQLIHDVAQNTVAIKLWEKP